ncbi:MAG: D-alanyl-D-alanine carboxypeptidase/D-alanyl-D-alanine-endopeptidase [Proteobacteria bacterium]|nr:D-alanyl-D-alanine carboxypeptidase/D-alanyl-D-alanine-endopeptidase [Burkholderiales bacterium]
MPLPTSVASALARAGIPEAATGVVVQSLDAREPTVALNADTVMNPASTIKLLTTYAALELLGPAFTWRTEILTAAEQRGEVLDGDLLIRGAGDPRLTQEAFWLLLRTLRARGIREIRGDVVLDRSAFAIETREASVFDNEPARPYNTPPDALLINFRAVMVRLLPDPQRASVTVSLDPPLPQVSLVGTVKADAGIDCGSPFAKLALDVQGNSGSARVSVSGAYPSACGERVWPISVLSHREYVFGLFQQLWRDMGGTLTGQLRDGVTPTQARVLATHTSPALSEIVRDINKWSNNVMAQQVYLALGAQTVGAPATWAKSARAVGDWARSKQLALPELALENGSGLSRVERITPRGLADLLMTAFRSPVMPELMASLPLVATDGTMRKRLANSGVAGQAHIKTGSLNDVRAIAGYVLDARGRRSVVVMIVNHPKALGAQPAFDAMLNWMHQRP